MNDDWISYDDDWMSDDEDYDIDDSEVKSIPSSIQNKFLYRNIKNNKLYRVLYKDVTDVSNAPLGRKMVIYFNIETFTKLYCREQ